MQKKPFPCFEIKKVMLIMNAFFSTHFTYYPLTWIFHNREPNYKIDRLHERFLRVVCHGVTSLFGKLLKKKSNTHYTIAVTEISKV